MRSKKSLFHGRRARKGKIDLRFSKKIHNAILLPSERSASNVLEPNRQYLFLLYLSSKDRCNLSFGLEITINKKNYYYGFNSEEKARSNDREVRFDGRLESYTFQKILVDTANYTFILDSKDSNPIIILGPKELNPLFQLPECIYNEIEIRLISEMPNGNCHLSLIRK